MAVMNARMSVSKAIWTGLLVVNGPVLLLLAGPPYLFGYLVDIKVISISHNWVGLPVFIVGVALAWLWWSVTIPKWRLWAYERVGDIAALKKRAVSAGLTWPDGHFFERTEIKSRAHARREKELDTTIKEQ